MIHNIQNHFTIDADGKITIPGDLEVTGIITNNGGPVQGGGGGGGGGQWSLNSSDIYFSTGNVGIGTTNPDSPLHVQGNFKASHDTTNATIMGNFLSASGKISSQLRMWNEDDQINVSILNDGNSYFKGGNVGIGTADPGSRLHVHGHGALSGIILGTDPNNANSASIVSPGNYIEDGIESRGLDLIASNHGTTDNGTFRFFTSHRATGERMRIDSAGKVGIGTAGAAQWGTLQVNNVTGDQTPNIDAWNQSTSSEDAHAIIRVGVHPGGGDAYYRAVVDGEDEWSFGLDSSDSNKFKINSSGALGNAEDRLTITGGGWVGIGKTSPASALHVVGASTIESSGPVLVLKDIDGGDVNTQTGFISYRDNDNTERAWVGFGSASTKDFAVRSNIGDLHLLTAAPSTKVYAQGSEVITAANIANYGGGTGSGQWNSNGSDIYFNLGNAGIGTNTPQHKLDVAGNAQISGPLGILDDVSIAKEGPVSQPDLLMRGINENTSDFSSDYLQTTYISSSMYNSDPTGTACQPYALYNIANSNNGTTESGPRLVLKHGVLASGSFAPTTSYLELRTSSPLVEGEKLARFEMFGNGDVKIGNIEKTSTGHDNNTYATFTSDGNVGIGTSSPGSLLTVSATKPRIQLHDNNDADKSWFFVGDGGAPNDGAFYITSGDDDYTNLSTRFYINHASGNVGIGTDSPGSRLEIVGDNAFAALRITDLNDGGTAANMMAITCAEYSGQGGNPNIIEAYNLSEISLRTGGGERLRIDNAGRVGIGTGSPSGDLELLSANTDTNLLMGGTPTAGLASREAWRIQAEGDKLHIGQNKSSYAKYMSFKGSNVGIGTETPTSALEVHAPNASSAFSIYNEVDDDLKMNSTVYDNGGALSLFNDGAVRVHIDGRHGTPNDTFFNAGKVGIGTATPGSPLHIEGAYDRTLYLTTTDTNGQYMMIQGAPDSSVNPVRSGHNLPAAGAAYLGNARPLVTQGSGGGAPENFAIRAESGIEFATDGPNLRAGIDHIGDFGIRNNLFIGNDGGSGGSNNANMKTLGRLVVSARSPDEKSAITVMNSGGGTGVSPKQTPLIEGMGTTGNGVAGIYTYNEYTNNTRCGLRFKTTDQSGNETFGLSLINENFEVNADTVFINTAAIAKQGCTTEYGKRTGLADGEYALNYVWANDAASEASLADYNGRSAGMGVYKNAGESWTSGYLWTVSSLGNHFYSWNDNSGVLRMSNSMSQIGGTGGTVVGAQTSDERLKDIDEEFNYGLSEVLKLKPISFTLKNDESDTKKLGFGAQTTQEVIPESVGDSGDCIDGYDVDEEDEFKQTPKSEDTILNMEYVQLIPVLTKAIQELKTENDELKERLQSIEDWRGNSV